MQRVKEFVKKIDKKELFIVLLIFLLAFGVRGHMMRYGLIWEFDTYFHARVVGEVIQNFAVPTSDWLAYYQLPPDQKPIPQVATFFWYFTAAIYKVFTLGAPYQKDLWFVFVKFLPALFGALISVAMYYFGKAMYGKRAGIVMGFFAGVVPAFVYRTMAGQFEEDSLGFLWLVIGFVFFVRAIKPLEFNRQTIKNAVLSGVFFGIMAWTWEMFLMIPLIMLAYLFWAIIVFWFKKQPREQMVNFAKIFAITFATFSVLAIIFSGTLWITRGIDYVVNYIPITPENIERPTYKPPGNVLAATVGEENTGRQYFGEKYNALIIFPILGLLFIPFKVVKKKDGHISLLIFFWAMLTLFMAWNKLKFTYTFGLPIAACAGFVFEEVFNLLKNRSPFEKKTVGLALAFMLLVGLGSASIFITTKVPNIEQATGWKETLYWIKDNTPTDAKMFNWWDEGHWITFVAERGVITDNRNMSGEANRGYTNFLLDENAGDSSPYGMVKSFGSDYVIVDSSYLSQLNSLALYAFNTTDFGDPRVTRYFGVTFNCNQQLDNLSNQTKYVCGPNTISQSDMDKIPTQWIPAPNQLIDKQIPGFLYKSPDNSAIFLLNPAVNKSFAARLLFGEPSITHFELVYSNKQVKVYKVK